MTFQYRMQRYDFFYKQLIFLREIIFLVIDGLTLLEKFLPLKLSETATNFTMTRKMRMPLPYPTNNI